MEHRMPSGKELPKIYTASASKRIYFRFGKAYATGKNLNFPAHTSQFEACQIDRADRFGDKKFHNRVRYLIR